MTIAERVPAYDRGIETNHDAWQAVHEGLRDGLSKLEIAERANLSYQMVGVYARQPRPSSIRRKLNSHHQGARLCACGRALSWSSKTLRCQACEHRRVRAEAGTPGRLEVLRSWALRHGHVPDVNTAAELLGLSRGRAGDLVLEAFGPDHREGGQRRQAYRGWPEGAPDVPRPDEVERMREHGRVYGSRNAGALRAARRIHRGSLERPLTIAEFEHLLADGRAGRFVVMLAGEAREVRT